MSAPTKERSDAQMREHLELRMSHVRDWRRTDGRFALCGAKLLGIPSNQSRPDCVVCGEMWERAV